MKGTLVSTEIAEPYAQALLSVAQSSNELDRISNDVRALVQLLKDSPELSDFIANPVIKEGAKKEVLNRAIGSEAHPYLLNFLMLLVDKRRIAFLQPIGEQYLNLVRTLTNTVLAEVSSATELNDSQRQTVIEKVKALTSAQVVELNTSVNPDLIGGVIIKVGSQVFDASIRGQLQRISNTLGRNV